MPKKIVWLYPICSYEEAVEKSASTRKNSYGEDAVKIKELLSGSEKTFTVEEIANSTGVSMERTKTLLYLMRTTDGVVGIGGGHSIARL